MLQTELFTSIKDNGYQFVYLSSRAIGQVGVCAVVCFLAVLEQTVW